MQTQPGLDAWTETVSQHMPHLSKPHTVVLALWSFGMVVTKSCGLTTVAAFLAALLGKKENTLRQRLREWYWEAKKKRGDKRLELDVSTCFVPLVHWVLSWWPATEQRLALALDATTLSDRFVVLAVSIVYRGCAIPIAWVVLPAGQKGAWKPHWLKLLQIIKRLDFGQIITCQVKSLSSAHSMIELQHIVVLTLTHQPAPRQYHYM